MIIRYDYLSNLAKLSEVILEFIILLVADSKET